MADIASRGDFFPPSKITENYIIKRIHNYRCTKIHKQQRKYNIMYKTDK